MSEITWSFYDLRKKHTFFSQSSNRFTSAPVPSLRSALWGAHPDLSDEDGWSSGRCQTLERWEILDLWSKMEEKYGKIGGTSSTNEGLPIAVVDYRRVWIMLSQTPKQPATNQQNCLNQTSGVNPKLFYPRKSKPPNWTKKSCFKNPEADIQQQPLHGIEQWHCSTDMIPEYLMRYSVWCGCITLE